MHIETLAVHAGHHPDPATGAVSPPISSLHHLRSGGRRDPAARVHLRPERQSDPKRAGALAGGAGRRRGRDRLRVRDGGDGGGVPVPAPGRARHRAAGRLLRHRQAAARSHGRLGAREHVRGHDRPARGGGGGRRRTPGSSGSRRRPTPPSPSPISRASRRSPARPARAASATTPGPRRCSSARSRSAAIS